MDEKILKRAEKLRAKADSLEARAEKILERVEELRSEADAAESKSDELNEQADELHDRALHINGEIESALWIEAEILEGIANDFEEKAEELNDKADELEEEADELNERAESLREEADELCNQDVQAKRKTSRADKNLNDALYDNSKKAMEEVFQTWIERAKIGDLNAIYEVGNCYYNGVGVDIDVEEALNWYKLAAEREHFVAAEQINEMYLRGESPEPFFAMPVKLPPTLTKQEKSRLASMLLGLFNVKKSEPYNGNFGRTDPKIAEFFEQLDEEKEEPDLDFDSDDDD